MGEDVNNVAVVLVWVSHVLIWIHFIRFRFNVLLAFVIADLGVLHHADLMIFGHILKPRVLQHLRVIDVVIDFSSCNRRSLFLFQWRNISLCQYFGWILILGYLIA